MAVGISVLFCTRLADEAADLWMLEDEAFVNAALTTMVDEVISPGDSERFVLLLRQGFSKHYVIAGIADHWGTAFRPGKLPGVRRRLGRFRMGTWPVLGFLLRLIFRLPSESMSQRRIRVVENQLYLLSKIALQNDGVVQLPAAPWGGLHRMPELHRLLACEARMSPEVKDTYLALLNAVNKLHSDDRKR